MNDYVKFKWGEGRVTYLWPDHPLVLAGDYHLGMVVDSFHNNQENDVIIKQLLNITDHPEEEVRSYVENVVRAIQGISDDNLINTTKPNADSLSMATINVTDNCNLDCRHCYAGSRNIERYEEMNIEEIENAVLQLSGIVKQQPRLLIFSGGEPLLRKEKLKAGIRKANSVGFNVRLNTNGILIEEELANFLCENNVLTQVSLDGADPKTNAILRGEEGAFEETIEGIKILVNSGCSVRISMTLHSGNKHQIPDLLNLALEIGAEQFITSSLVGIGRALENDIRPVEFADEFTMLFNEIRDNKRKQEMTSSTLLGETIAAIRNGIRFVYCGSGCSTLCLGADGSLYPCINLVGGRYLVGRLNSNNLRDIWINNKELIELRKLDVSSMNLQCGKCKFRHFCGGYCRGETIAGGGEDLLSLH